MPTKKKRTNLSPHTLNRNWRHVSAYIPLDIFEVIETQAEKTRRSLSAQVVVMLETAAKAQP